MLYRLKLKYSDGYYWMVHGDLTSWKGGWKWTTLEFRWNLVSSQCGKWDRTFDHWFIIWTQRRLHNGLQLFKCPQLHSTLCNLWLQGKCNIRRSSGTVWDTYYTFTFCPNWTSWFNEDKFSFLYCVCVCVSTLFESRLENGPWIHKMVLFIGWAVFQHSSFMHVSFTDDIALSAFGFHKSGSHGIGLVVKLISQKVLQKVKYVQQ